MVEQTGHPNGYPFVFSRSVPWAETSTTIEVIEPLLLAEGMDQARRVDIAKGFFPRDREREPVFQKANREILRTASEGEGFPLRHLDS